MGLGIARKIKFFTMLYVRRGYAWWYPAIVQIEATSRCNLRCPSCSHSRETGMGQHLTAGDLAEILGRLPFPPNQVTLSGVGEPLLNPHFLPMVDLLADRQIQCNFYTNGTLLTPEMGEAILERGNVVQVVFSCDGARKETFEQQKLGADFERWKQSVGDFVQRAGEERPDLVIYTGTVISRQNIGELGEIVDLASGLGIRRVYFWDPEPANDQWTANIPSMAELAAIDFPEVRERGRSHGTDVFWRTRRETVPPQAIPRCTLPWDYVFIRADGNIQPCDGVYSKEQAAVMGNLYEADFPAIWNGDRYRRYRTTHITGENSHCRECPYY